MQEKQRRYEHKVDGWGVCELTRHDATDIHEYSTLALACDADAYFAETATAPDFGCIQFEPKE